MKPELFFLLAGCALGQSGVLTDSVTGEPVKRASVTAQFLSGPGGGVGTVTALTDAGGHFEFPALQGVYRYWAERRGYPRQEIATSGTAPKDLSFRLEPYSVLVGRVLDENGDPIQGAEVQVVASEIRNGRRQYRAAATAATNDRGEYRAASLAKGKYLVSAYARAQDAGQQAVYPRRFSPAPLVLQPGVPERADFRLQPEPTFAVRGRVTNALNLTGLSLTLAAADPWETFGGAGYSSQIMGEGRFEVKGVPPGRYLLKASGFRAGASETATQPIAVGRADVEGVPVNLAVGATVAGEVTVADRRPALSLVHELVLEPEDAVGMAFVPLSLEAGKFAVARVPPGRYILRANVPEPYYLKSDERVLVESAGETRLTVEIGNHGAEVSGVLAGGPLAGNTAASVTATVLLLRDDGAVRFAQPDPKGVFTIRALAPGGYTAYAFHDLTAVEYRNPEAMRAYTGVTFKVEEGAKLALETELRLGD